MSWVPSRPPQLGNIEIASRLLDSSQIDSTIHPVDARYAQLGSTLTPIDAGSELHGLLAQYLKNTHAATHASYTLELMQVNAPVPTTQALSLRTTPQPTLA